MVSIGVDTCIGTFSPVHRIVGFPSFAGRSVHGLRLPEEIASSRNDADVDDNEDGKGSNAEIAREVVGESLNLAERKRITMSEKARFRLIVVETVRFLIGKNKLQDWLTLTASTFQLSQNITFELNAGGLRSMIA